MQTSSENFFHRSSIKRNVKEYCMLHFIVDQTQKCKFSILMHEIRNVMLGELKTPREF